MICMALCLYLQVKQWMSFKRGLRHDVLICWLTYTIVKNKTKKGQLYPLEHLLPWWSHSETQWHITMSLYVIFICHLCFFNKISFTCRKISIDMLMSLLLLKKIFSTLLFSYRKFRARGGGTHQFRVELLGRPPPIHGHQGLCGRGDAVAIEVKLALTVSIGARASLGTGGNEAAGPRIHLPMQRATRCWNHFGYRIYFFSVLWTDIDSYVMVPKRFLVMWQNRRKAANQHFDGD